MNRWHIAEMAGQRIGLRWADVYPLLDRVCPEPADWDRTAQELELMESAVLDPSYNPHLNAQ